MQFTGGDKSRYQKNIRAIRILKTLEQEERNATKEEQEILAGYVGWGGLPNAFNSKRPEWKKEYQELKELLTAEEYAQQGPVSTVLFIRRRKSCGVFIKPWSSLDSRREKFWNRLWGLETFFMASGKYAKIPALWRGD